MSRKPAIVAELGRPETPTETAARKAASSAAHRRNQTFTNLLLSLAASLGIVAIIVIFVLRPDPEPAPAIDVAGLADEAQAAVDATLLAPALPEGWGANAAELRGTDDDVVSWYVGYVTPDTEFVSLTQGLDADDTWLSDAIRDADVTGAMTVGDVEWQVHDQRDDDDAGNLEYVMTTVHDDETIVLAGTAADTEFLQFAEAVSAELAP